MDTSTIRQLGDSRALKASRAENPDFLGTLAKGLMLLQVFVGEPRPHANSELASRLGLPRPTVSRLCATLREMGYLDLDERTDRYFIGPAAVALGYPYVVNTPLLDRARPALQALADQMEGAVSVGVAMDLDVVYIESCTWRSGTLARPAVGALRTIVSTAMGRAWLGTLDARSRATLLRRARQQRPEETKRCMAGIDESLAVQAERGFAVNRGDMGLGVHAVGVASKLRYGARLLLFNCAVPGSHLRKGDLDAKVGPRLVEIVRAAERGLGGG